METGSLENLCSKCTHTSCCNNFVTPFVTPSEKEKISNIGHKDFSEDFNTHGMNVHALKKKPGTDECVFWEKDKGCGIYQNRPFDCMLFPFDIYKINGEYTWVVYSCNPESNWTWTEKILVSLEEDIISEEIIKYLDAYSDVERLDVSDKSFDLVELRKVNLNSFKQSEQQLVNERRRSSSR